MKKTASWNAKAGKRAVLVPSNVFQRAYCKELVALTVKGFGKSDLLVNNATFQASQGLIEEIGAEEWGGAFRTNIYAYFYLAIVRQMLTASTIATSSVNTKNMTAGVAGVCDEQGRDSERSGMADPALCELTLTIRLAAQELRARPPAYEEA